MSDQPHIEFANRLNEAMKRVQFEIIDLKNSSGVSYEMIRRYTLGIAKPREDKLQKIANTLGVRVGWLDYGEGEMLSAKAQVDELVASMPNGITHDEIEPWREQVWVNFYDVSFCCGSGRGYPEFEPLKKTLPFDQSFFKYRNLDPKYFKIIYAKGDSMAHYIQEGDAVGIDVSDTEPREGEVYALFWDGDLLIKRIYKEGGGVLRLTSDNKSYPEKIVNETNGESLVIIGRVVYRSG